MFLACATPELTEDLLRRVISGQVPRTYVETNKLRNSVVDLSALGLVEWKADALVPTKVATASSSAGSALRQAVSEASTFQSFERLLIDNPHASRPEIGFMLSSELGKIWKESSALRYANGLHRYREHINCVDMVPDH
jgi:hypothetical protein